MRYFILIKKDGERMSITLIPPRATGVKQMLGDELMFGVVIFGLIVAVVVVSVGLIIVLVNA